jgi:Altered inheritance of mitochondria 5
MSRTWAFVGGLLIVSTVTYINMSTIKVVTYDVRKKLERQQKRLADARNANNPQSSGTGAEDEEPKKGISLKFPTPTTISTRIKKTWNEDVERTVRKVQNTNWEKVAGKAGERLDRFRRRIWEDGVDSEEKKSSS